ncbi:MAG: transposase [Treponema sp.]|jgi:REP element-mobilizing transposase RayT|nr:transposase [Treponema sp.]
MRSLRLLKPGVWYEVITRINNREPLFRRYSALAIFVRIFREANLLFAFEIRRLHLEDDLLRFYIKPKNGLELSAIMKWMKQVFAQRFIQPGGRGISGVTDMVRGYWRESRWRRSGKKPGREWHQTSGSDPLMGKRR